MKLLFIRSWNVFWTAVLKIHLLFEFSSDWQCFFDGSKSGSVMCSSCCCCCLRGFGGRPRFLAIDWSLLWLSGFRGVRLSSSMVDGSFKKEKKSGSSRVRLAAAAFVAKDGVAFIGVVLFCLLVLFRGFLFEGFVWSDGGVESTEVDLSIFWKWFDFKDLDYKK